MEDWLHAMYHIVLPNPEQPLQDDADLVIIDGPSLKQLRPKVKALRRSHEPVLLPFLLLTVRRRHIPPSPQTDRVFIEVASCRRSAALAFASGSAQTLRLCRPQRAGQIARIQPTWATATERTR